MQRRTPAGLISQFVRLLFSRRRSAARIATLLVGIAIYVWQTYPFSSHALQSNDGVQEESSGQSDISSHVRTSPAKSTSVYVSPAGVRYGADPSGKFDSRVEHVMAHTQEDKTKMRHSVFVVKSRDDVLALVDEAWKKRGPPRKQGKKYPRDVYDVDMGRVIGTQGQRVLRMITEADSADIVTAYPMEKKHEN